MMALLGSAKPLASLSSGLLARKGQARPAMRRQGYDHAPGTAPDDLGWNDMGGLDPQPVAPPPLAPAPHDAAPELAAYEAVPSVLVEREALARQVEQPDPEPATDRDASASPDADLAAADPEPALSRRKACRIARESAAQTARGKAAFTLRLDPERHLRLRLASAVVGQSAQFIVAGALDRFLESMPEVEALAAQLPIRKVRP